MSTIALRKKIAFILFIAMAIALPCLLLPQARLLAIGVISLTVGFGALFAAIDGVELGTIGGASGYRAVLRDEEPVKFWLTFGVFVLLGLAATLLAFFILASCLLLLARLA